MAYIRLIRGGAVESLGVVSPRVSEVRASAMWACGTLYQRLSNTDLQVTFPKSLSQYLEKPYIPHVPSTPRRMHVAPPHSGSSCSYGGDYQDGASTLIL